MRNKIILALAMLAAFVWSGPLLAQTTRYVWCNNGSNGNSGADWDNAWDTIEYAATQVSANYLVYIRTDTPGSACTPSTVQFTIDGTLGNEITFSKHPSYPMPDINIPTNNSNVGLNIKADYVVLDGLDVSGSQYSTVYISNCTHSTVRNCIIDGPPSHVALNITTTDGAVTYFTAEYNEIYSAGDECVYVDTNEGNKVDNDYHLFQYNEIHDCGWEGIQQSVGDSSNEVTPDNNTWRGNVVYDAGKTVDWAIVVLVGQNLVFENNLIRNNETDSGNQLVWISDAPGIVFRNNLIYENDTSSEYSTYAAIHLESNADGALIYNNTIADNTSRGIGIASGVSGVLIKNNISSGNLDQCVCSGSCTIDTNVFYGTTTSSGSNAITTDPYFTDSTNDDYTLKFMSPAIDIGIDLGDANDDALSPESSWPDSVATLDQDDYGAGWDLGAYVFPPLIGDSALRGIIRAVMRGVVK